MAESRHVVSPGLPIVCPRAVKPPPQSTSGDHSRSVLFHTTAKPAEAHTVEYILFHTYTYGIAMIFAGNATTCSPVMIAIANRFYVVRDQEKRIALGFTWSSSVDCVEQKHGNYIDNIVHHHWHVIIIIMRLPKLQKERPKKPRNNPNCLNVMYNNNSLHLWPFHVSRDRSTTSLYFKPAHTTVTRSRHKPLPKNYWGERRLRHNNNYNNTIPTTAQLH